MYAVRMLSVLVLLMIVPLSALAQDGIQPYVEYRKRVESSQNVSPLDSGLFGEQVSLYNGSTSFSVTDIDVPGHHGLPVQLTRTFAVELQPQNFLGGYDSLLRGVGNWDVEVPYMAATYNTSAGAALRCDGLYESQPVIEGFFSRSEVWHGISINVPARGKTTALWPQAGVPRPSGGATYKLSTSERDVLECTPMQPGFTGQGFRMTTASGLRYYFDVGASRTAATLEKGIKYVVQPFPVPVYLPRNRLYLLASKIEDRFGNTVQFQYNANGHPTRIWANDGREINLSYTSGRLTTATSHGRTWQYQYASSPVSGMYAWLSQVTLPDSSKWQYTYNSTLMPTPDRGLPSLPWCSSNPVMISDAFTLTATHPSGATGAFDFSNRRHYRSGVHATECMSWGDPAHENYVLLVPHFYDVMSINSKTLSGPGLSPMTWSYAYGPHMQTLWGTHTVPLQYPCTTCQESKTVSIINPDNTKSRYTFGIRYQDNDGRQLKVETLRADDTVIRTETNTYMTEAQAAIQPFFGVYGSVLGGFIMDPASVRIRPVTNRTINQDGVNFIWQANTFDTMARPKNVTRSSTVSGNPTRTEETTYHDNLVKWVLGQVSKVVCKAPTANLPAGCGATDTEMFERTYDSTYAMPLVTERFNKPEQILTWDTTSPLSGGQRGTAKTVADGNGNITALSSWKRGTPQSIKYPGTPEAPSGATQTAQVNDSGWLNWVEDENAFRTNYTYDAMGRLASIVYPTGDSTTWNTTTQVFQQIAATEYGIPAGHWRQTVSTGNGRKITYFDGLWRPLVTREYDTANEAGTQRFQRFTYDHEGRNTFASYPATVHNPTTGTWSEYDVLGRPTSVSQDSELGLLTTTTAYLSGFQTRITNPKNHQTTTSYLAWDQPTTDFPARITHPASAYTHITRDVFGKPTVLRRSNSSSPTGGTVALNRSYAYNAHQELCRSVEPETGATLMGYDAAGNLTWSASGLSAGTACHATGNTTAINARKAVRTYDARNRLTTLSFPDGRGNQTWSYAADGLPTLIATTLTGSDRIITNQYTYNRRRLLTTEVQQATGWSALTFSRAYNANGHLSNLTYPSNVHGPVVDYAPNALGQPTKVGTFASAVTYFPNGAVKSFTYGNGIKHTLAQNLRGLPDTSCDFATSCNASAVLNDGYDYDQNGNVAAISDGRTGNRGNRTMSYDPLDRLLSTSSPMFGTASYAYDVLDNLTRVHLTGGNQARNHHYCYDTNWQLTNVKTGSCSGATVIGLGYDAQGNLANKSGQGYEFDFGNRLRAVPGREDSFHYDGHGRRALSIRRVNGSSWLRSVYGVDGKLLFQQDQGAATRKDYIYLGNTLIAERSRPNTASTPVSVRYQHTDALGSPVAISNESQVVVERTEYEPYGHTANRAARSGPGYTGHMEDAATGLTYMQQRYYDPQLGVFLSVDPVTAYADPVSQFHRYRYAANNPYKYVDPDGRLIINAVGGIGGGIVGGIGGGITGYITSGGNLRKTFAGAAGGVVGGAITGATLGSGAGAGTLVAAGIAGGLAGEVVNQGVDNLTEHGTQFSDYEISYGRIAVSGLVGPANAFSGGLIDDLAKPAFNQLSRTALGEGASMTWVVPSELAMNYAETGSAFGISTGTPTVTVTVEFIPEDQR